MPVNFDPISIDPYRSQVPLVQIPQQDLQGPPQQGGIYSKTGGIATIADGAMKGLLKGLQMKEEKKYKTAEAVMNAQDAGIGAAKKNYEDLLTTKGAFEADGKTPKAETQAAYAAWQTAVNAAAAQRQAFAVPEKTPKQPKGQKKDKTAADGAPAAPGFGGALKQFFERNPHVLPELTITAWKAGQNTPYGQMAPEQQKQKMEMDAAQRQESIAKVTDAAVLTRDKYAGKSESELAKMPPSSPNGPFKNALEEYRNAVEALTPLNAATKYQTMVDPQGQQHSVPLGTQIPEGWKLYEKPTASTTPRVGSPEEITANYLSQHKIKPEDAPPELLKYLRDYATYKAAQTTSGTSEHMETDPKTGELVAVKTGSSSTRGAAAPKPPAGFAPVGEDGQPLKEAPQSAYQRNQAWSKPGPYVTQLAPQEEQKFQQWVQANHVPWQDSPTSDYDMRGYWKAMQSGDPSAAQKKSGFDGKMHFPDTYKTPYHKTFSSDSQYATQGAPKWQGNVLKDANGNVVADESPRQGRMTKPPAAPGAGRGAMTAPPGPSGVRDIGIKSMPGVGNTQRVETEEKGMYTKADAAYQAALKNNKAKAPDKASLDKANAEALQDYTARKAEIVLWKAAQIKALGGDPWKGDFIYDPQGNLCGTMDGVNWVNIRTGYPYEQQ